MRCRYPPICPLDEYFVGVDVGDSSPSHVGLVFEYAPKHDALLVRGLMCISILSVLAKVCFRLFFADI